MGLLHERSVKFPNLVQERLLLVFWTLVLAGVLARLGTPGADLAGWLGRYAFWTVHVGVGLLLTAGIMRLLQSRLEITRPSLGLLVGAGMLGAVAFAPLALMLDALGGELGWTEVDADEAGLAMALLSELAALAPLFVAMWLVVQLPILVALRAALRAETASAAPAAEEPMTDADGGILSKLPPALGDEVISVEADLNYVHVATRLGKTMLLYSLRQAAADLGEQGLLIHRSVWIATAAVTRVKRNGPRLLVRLENGRELTVSRRRQAEVIAQFGSDFAR